MKQTFTKKTLSTLSPPASGRRYVHDTHDHGLSAYITAAGIITFYVRKRINGRDERVVIGRFPEVTIEQARAKALAIRA